MWDNFIIWSRENWGIICIIYLILMLICVAGLTLCAIQTTRIYNNFVKRRKKIEGEEKL